MQHYDPCRTQSCRFTASVDTLVWWQVIDFAVDIQDQTFLIHVNNEEKMLLYFDFSDFAHSFRFDSNICSLSLISFSFHFMLFYLSLLWRHRFQVPLSIQINCLELKTKNSSKTYRSLTHWLIQVVWKGGGMWEGGGLFGVHQNQLLYSSWKQK